MSAYFKPEIMLHRQLFIQDDRKFIPSKERVFLAGDYTA